MFMKTMPRRVPGMVGSIVALSLVVGTLTGCAFEFEYDEEDVEVTDQPLFSGNTGFYWTGSLVMIPVCFKSPTPANQNIRDDVRRRIEGQWSRWARVNFTGWGDCASAPSGKRVEITLDSTKNGGQCPPTTLKCWFGTKCVATSGVSCLGGMPTHEMGHAIGFFHEEERPDYKDWVYWGGATKVPGGCAQQDYCTNPNYGGQNCPPKKHEKLGGYDPQSIMSYCAAKDHPDQLSPNDIASVQHVYGWRKQGQIVSPLGNCAAANVNDVNPVVFSWDCDEAPGQFWKYNAQNRIQSNVDSTKCWHYSGAGGYKPANGTVIKIGSCGSAPIFATNGVEIIGYGGKCLDLRNGNTTNGTPVQTWECLGNSNQKWGIGANGVIRFGSNNSSKCLSVSGSLLVISDCLSGYFGQKFVFADGSLKLATDSTKCLDVPAAWDADYAPNGAVGTASAPNLIPNGRQVQVFQCLPAQINQKWFVRGALKTGWNMCVDLPNGTFNNGAVLQLWDCLNNNNQVWDMRL